LLRHGHLLRGRRARRRGNGQAHRPLDRQRVRARPRRDGARAAPAPRGAAARLRIALRARTGVSATTPVASAASDALARPLLDAGARGSAFLGLAKNVGKPTALVATLASLHRRGIAVGATSAGRDGEAFDAITGEPKPRFRIWRGQFVASATSTFASA